MKYITIDRIILVGLIILLLSLYTCQRKKTNIAESAVTALQLKNQTLDSIKNTLNQVVITQKVIETSNQKSIRDLSDSMFKLTKAQDKKIKEVIAYYSSVSKTQIKDKLVPYLDSNKMRKFSDSLEAKCSEILKFYRDSSIQVPKSVLDSTKHFVIDGTILRNGFNINNISFPDSTHLRFVEHKGGLFKKNTTEVQVLHTNPYVSVTSSNSVIYKPPAKARWLERLALVAAGIFIGTKL